jgi:hypothetical protein
MLIRSPATKLVTNLQYVLSPSLQIITYCRTGMHCTDEHNTGETLLGRGPGLVCTSWHLQGTGSNTWQLQLQLTEYFGCLRDVTAAAADKAFLSALE